MAVFTLPPEMIKFYKANIDYITEHAVDPDKRRYISEKEGAKHYIDIDRYVGHNEDVLEVLPKKWIEAVKKYSEDTLEAYGIVPWQVNLIVIRLTKAFEAKNKEEILRCSSDLGHYVADSHVPLHTTQNYNGQMTNQHGIHGFWESRLPELKSKEYDFFTGRATYVEYILDDEWMSIKESFSAKDSVLTLERELDSIYPKDQKYTYENRGNSLLKVYSEEYATAYHQMLNGMVERRMLQAILKIGNYWYTAWVNAGQPNLDELADKKTITQLQEEDKLLEQQYKINSQIKGRNHDD